MFQELKPLFECVCMCSSVYEQMCIRMRRETNGRSINRYGHLQSSADSGRSITNTFLTMWRGWHLSNSVFILAVSVLLNKFGRVLPGGSVVKGPPANAGGMDSILVREDPTHGGETKPGRHSYWACAQGPGAPTAEAGGPASPSWRQSILRVHREDWSWSWNPSTLATWCKELTPWKRPWYWEGLGAGGEGDDRGWDGWMASRTRWTWVWVNSGSWWWTGRPGVLQSLGSQSRTQLSDWTALSSWACTPQQKRTPQWGVCPVTREWSPLPTREKPAQPKTNN